MTAIPVTDRGRSTRSKLLAVAERVFGELGYEAASVTSITHEAGIAQGSFYTYFPSKLAIFEEVMRRAAGGPPAPGLGGRERRRRPRREPHRDRARAAWRPPSRSSTSAPACSSSSGSRRRCCRKLYRWWVDSFVAAYIENFDRFTPERDADLDIEAIACVVQGAFDMLNLWYVHWRGEVPPPAVIDQTFDILGRGLDSLVP